MNPWRGLSKLPKEVWVIAITTLINRAGTMVFPFLIFYLPQVQLSRGVNLSLGEIGFILALFGIGAFATAPIAGWLSDKVGAAQVMKLSLVLSGAILLVYPLANSFLLIAFLTFIWAVTSESFRPASYAILSTIVMGGDDELTRKNSKMAQALSRLAINLGMMIGPVVASIFAKYNRWELLFLVDGATSILAFVYLSIMLRPTKFQTHDLEIHTTENVVIPVASSRAIKDRRFIYFLVAIIPIWVIIFQEFSAMPQFMKDELNLDEFFYGFLVALNAALIIVFELPLNSVTGGWSYRRSLTWGAILFAVGFGALGFANGFIFLVITVVIWTFGEMLLLPNMVAYVGSIAAKKRQGEYMGLYSMIFSLSMTLAPWVGIATLNRYGGKFLWGAAFVLGLISALMFSQLNRAERITVS
jgi:MFS family permease